MYTYSINANTVVYMIMLCTPGLYLRVNTSISTTWSKEWNLEPVLLTHSFGFCHFQHPRMKDWTIHSITFFSQLSFALITSQQKAHMSLYFRMSFNPRSTRSRPVLMLSPGHPEPILHKIAWMHEKSFRIVHTDFNDDIVATNLWARLLNSKGVQDGNDQTAPRKEQDRNTSGGWVNSKAYNVIPIKIKEGTMAV